MRYRRVVPVLALLAGCFSPHYDNGQVQCSSDGRCPAGYACASDNHCWKPGTGPMPTPSDLSDNSISDMGPPPDLAPLIYPPAAVWVSSGGGAVAATSGAQLGTSMGMTVGNGVSTAASGASISFGYLLDGTY